MGEALKDFLLFLILGALNVDRMPGVAGINLKSEATNLRTKEKKKPGLLITL